MTDVITNTSHLWYMNSLIIKKCIVGTLPLGLAGSGTKNVGTLPLGLAGSGTKNFSASLT